MILRVLIEGEPLGYLELPVFDGVAPDLVVRDAIVAQFAWPILERFIRDDQNRWAIFMRDIWGLPDAALNDFYSAPPDAPAGLWQFAGKELALEITSELPDVHADGPVSVVPKVGSAAAGVVRIDANGGLVTAARLRAAITTQTGFELCRIAVREALIGAPLGGPGLRARLMACVARALPSPVTGLRADWRGTVIGARASGPIGTSASRWAGLPSECEALTLEAAAEEGLPVIRTGSGSAKRLIYHPGLIDANEKAQTAEEPSAAAGSQRSMYDRTHWESLFAGGADPWEYENSYERLKYEQTASLIPSQRLARALELGCAEGHFTARLAERVDQLTAADISEIALGRARERCAAKTNVSWRRLNVVTDELGGPWDLIVCSEMLYYLHDREELDQVARKLAAALRPGGWLVTAHAHVRTDDPESSGFDWPFPFGVKVIGDALAAAPPLRLRRMIRTPLYRVMAFQSGANGTRAVEVIETNHAEPLPPRLAEMARRRATPTTPALSSWTPQTHRLPILMYHRVAPSGSSALARWRLHPDQFREQMAYLAETGYRAIGLDEWRVACGNHRPLPGRAVVITFDDGYPDFAEYAWPVLKQYGFTPYLFIPTQLAGKTNEWDADEENLELMDWPEILRLRDEGVRIGSHAASHRSLLSLSYSDVYAELVSSRLELRRKLEGEVDTIAYPFGEMDGVIAHLAGAAGYRYGLTTESVAAQQHKAMLELPRVEVRSDAGFEAFVNGLKQT